MKMFLTALAVTLLFISSVGAQPKPKPKLKTSAQQPASGMSKQAEKMMEDAMKAQGMSKEEIAEMKKNLGEAQKTVADLQQQGLMPASVQQKELTIPAKKTALISQIPKITSREQYASYMKQLLADCKAKIDPSLITEVDALFTGNAGNIAAQANLVPLLLIGKKPGAAIYAAVKAANAFPASANVQNNLGVTLHQTGYAHKAIPVLQYLLTQTSDPVLQNNLGQCYLSLGDTAKARQFFMGCLRSDAGNADALCGTALILDAGGKKTEAQVYIKKALENGYSAIAEGLAEKNKQTPKFSDIREDIPEYFNAQKYQPTASATEMNEVAQAGVKRLELSALVELWDRKHTEYAAINNAKKETENLGQLVKRYGGYAGALTGTGGVMSAKARMMFESASYDYAGFIQKYAVDRAEYIRVNKEMSKELDNRIEAVYKSGKFESADAECVQQINFLNDYLKKSAAMRDDFIRMTLPKFYDHINQITYWSAFLMNKEEYQQFYLQTVADFLERLSGYDDVQQLYPTPEGILYRCRNKQVEQKENPLKDSATATPDCPLKVEIPAGVAKFKVSCESFEVEGGELIQGGFEKNFTTGEMTFFVGLGVGFYEKGGVAGGLSAGVEAGAKAGVFVKLDGSGNVIDCGDKAEIGIEGGVGPLMTEAKLTGVLGMQSGGKLESSVAGTETLIWKTE